MEIDEILKEQGTDIIEKPVDGDVGGDPGAGDKPFKVSEYFEGFESVESVNEAIERSKLYSTEVEQELDTLRQGSSQVEGLQKEVKELKERQPFHDPKFYQLDKLTKEDPDKSAVYQRYMFGDNSDESVVKLRMMAEHPKRFKDNPGYLQRQLHNKYPSLFSDDPDSDSDEYKDDQTALGIAADEARSKFDGEIGKVEVPTIKKEEDIKAESEKFFADWKDPFVKVKEAITKISIPVLDEKDDTKQAGYMDYDIPEADMKGVQETAANHIANSQLEPTKENVQEAVDVALGVYFVKNQAKIFTAFANKIQKETGAEWRKRVNNSEKPGADGKIPGKNKGPEEGTGEYIMDDIRKS